MYVYGIRHMCVMCKIWSLEDLYSAYVLNYVICIMCGPGRGPARVAVCGCDGNGGRRALLDPLASRPRL